ncbi:MAG TPA: enoyl-CoA hydratase/isomerase family protein [Burkholderiaceae bacterium]|nr:enoyl-CoA hydratase/isomerase family protein [Burkholderiaceae bacterium]
MSASSVVLFDELPTAGHKKVAIATLNRPEVLNGLSLAMCEKLDRQLRHWELDNSIALVILNASGNRAFCAGGDLHSLYHSIRENVSGRPWDNDYAREFFAKEYRLDYLIHTYSKPVLCWGNGIIMGGGVGLMMGASHRVVTETTRYAMPEIKIGIFPDVGGSWMLSRLPEGVGMFLALTGAQLGASDCRHLGLADYFLRSDGFDAMLAAIQARSWSGERPEDDIRLHQTLQDLRDDIPLASGPLQANQGLINEYCRGPDFEAICNNVAQWAEHEDEWLATAAKTFIEGSPGSARLGYTLQKMASVLSLADVFRLEYVVALQCVSMGDFKEGVRALLVDKDKQPAWNPATIAGASHEWVQRFFVAPWPEGSSHPLADLGKGRLWSLPEYL